MNVRSQVKSVRRALSADFRLSKSNRPRLNGIILRKHLHVILTEKYRKKLGHGANIAPPTRAAADIRHTSGGPEHLDWNDLEATYPRYPSLDDIHGNFTEEQRHQWIDLSPYMGVPHIVQEHASLKRVFTLFRNMAMRHLVVVDRFASPVGIITRSNLTDLEESKFAEQSNHIDTESESESESGSGSDEGSLARTNHGLSPNPLSKNHPHPNTHPPSPAPSDTRAREKDDPQPDPDTQTPPAPPQNSSAHTDSTTHTSPLASPDAHNDVYNDANNIVSLSTTPHHSSLYKHSPPTSPKRETFPDSNAPIDSSKIDTSPLSSSSSVGVI